MKPAPPVINATHVSVLPFGSRACRSRSAQTPRPCRRPIAQTRMERQRQHFVARARGDGAVRRMRCPRAPAGAEWEPDNESASRCRRDASDCSAAASSPVRRCARGRRTDDRRGRDRIRAGRRRRARPSSSARYRAASARRRAVHAAEARQAGAEDGGLHLVEPRVHAGVLMMIPVGLAAVAQPLDARRQRAIVRDDGAAVAERAEILGRIEAERAGDADRADGTAVGRREMCLAAVFDDRERVPRGDPLDAPSCRPAGRTGAPAESRACEVRSRASTWSGSSVRRAGSMSANTGRAPAIMTASAVYAAESGVVMTSSPGPMPSARRISAIASVPLPTPTACAAPIAARELRFERLDFRARARTSRSRRRDRWRRGRRVDRRPGRATGTGCAT